MHTTRMKWLDVCKGVGILLVVLGHVTHGYLDGIGAFWGTVDRMVYGFHMPLFFLLSGMTFSLAYCREGSRLGVQIKNLAWVFALFSIAQWFVKYLFSAYVNNEFTLVDLALFALRPMPPYWYLWVLMIYYGVFYLLDRKHIPPAWTAAVCLAVSVGGSFLTTGFHETPKNLLLFALPFALGYLRLPEKCSPRWAVAAPALLVPAALLDVPVLGICAGTAVALGVIALLRAVPWECSWLQALGRHSLEIYVLHCFIIAPMRAILSALGITSMAVCVPVSVAAAVGGSLLAAALARKWKLYRLVFKPFC